jgi:acetylornithine deacetylase
MASIGTELTEAQSEAIATAVEAGFAEQARFLSALVRHASLRGAEAGAQDFLQREYEARGYAVERVRTRSVAGDPRFSPATVPYDESWNLVAQKPSAGGPGRSLILNAHVDVVPTGPEARWTRAPFSGDVEGGRLHGRGAGDMKAGMAAIVFALDALAAAGFEPDGRVQIQSVVEEEITGNGAATLLAAGHTADAILIPEPTEEALVRANTGVIKFRVTVLGNPTHPRDPDSGRSAIELAVHLMRRLKGLEQRWIAQAAAHEEFAGIPNPVALTIGTIAGGEWIASLPSECVLEGRVGFYPGEAPAARCAEFEAFVREVAGTDAEFRGADTPLLDWVGVCQPGYVLAPGGAAEAVLAEAHAAIRSGGVRGGNQTLTAFTMPCYLDSTLFAVHAGMPALVYGPMVANIHGIDEWVDLDSLKRVTKTIALFVAGWCGLRALQNRL